jgi:two-component system NtrC family sensor kinase
MADRSAPGASLTTPGAPAEPGTPSGRRRASLSVATRIFLSFAAIVAAFAFATVFMLGRMGSLRDSVTVLWKELVPTVNQLRILSRQLKSVEEFLAFRRPDDAQWLRQVLPGLDPFGGPYGLTEAGARLTGLSQARALLAAEREVVARVGATLSGFADAPALAEAVAIPGERLCREGGGRPSGGRACHAAVVAEVVRAAEAGRLGPGAAEAKALLRALRRLHRELNESVRALGGPVRELDVRVEADSRDATLVVVGVALAALLVSLGMLAVVQATLRPIRALRESARRIAGGHYDERVPLKRADELGELAAEFNTMAESLAARDAALAAKQKELLRAERLAVIGRFAAQIAHEVRNPLSSIGLNAELLEDEIADLPSTSAARPLLAAISREVERMKGITEDYLQFTRIPRAELGAVPLGPLLREFLTFIGRELEAASVRLAPGLEAIVAQAGSCAILADPQQARQALLNLVRNALEAMGEAPRELRVEVAREEEAEGGPRVRVTLSDTGRGLSPAMRDRLFEPFATDKPQGTGLGLALTRDIMTAHGGEVTIGPREATEPERGTRVTLCWRLAATAS